MTEVWRKMGRVFDPRSHTSWFKSHAALPIVEPLDGDLVRVYFSGRDSENRAQIGFFDIDIVNPGEANVCKAPALALGDLGAFDDSGVTCSCIVNHDGKKYLYYSGWTVGVTVPFYFFAGLAISEDGGRTFERVHKAPILERNAIDPYLTASPYVIVEKGLWRMWYVSATGWTNVQGFPQHRYHIKYAESVDGRKWIRNGLVALDYRDGSEYAFARPCVVKDGAKYKMWFSYRGASYRIGYAESVDGFHWTRNDDMAGIMPSQSGWDSEMIEYPFVFDHNGLRYMFYNGNGYGESGIGFASCEYSIVEGA